MVGMHAKGDVGLSPVTAEVSLADQKADWIADVEAGWLGLLFHRHVSRETF